jgi:ABC-type branched-subunit amino acid transport system ATPase component
VSSGRFHTDRCGLIATVLRLPKYRRVRRADREEGLTALGVVGLAHLADREAGELSLGTRRLVEVARSLCAHPGLILLDEPASGLSEDEINRLGKVIQAASAAGATVILVEHNFSFVTRICDVVNVLHQGCLIASGSAATVAADPAVIVSYLGEKHASPAGQAASDEGHSRTGQRLITTESGEVGAGADAPELVLQLQDAVSGYRDLKVLRGVSLDLRRGQVEVVLGRNGVGKTTLMGSIAGLIPLWEGRLLLDGYDVTSQAPANRAARGIALVQEGKRIFHRRTVLENVVLGSHSLKLQRSERRQFCESILDQFPVLKPRAHELAGRLSGGQQQMLAIAQALASRPKVLLLDEPSAGLAPSIVDDIFSQIRSLSDAGMTVLLVEQVAEQALRIGDHVSIINDGQVVASGAPDDFSHREELYAAYFGSALKAPR